MYDYDVTVVGYGVWYTGGVGEGDCLGLGLNGVKLLSLYKDLFLMARDSTIIFLAFDFLMPWTGLASHGVVI